MFSVRLASPGHPWWDRTSLSSVCPLHTPCHRTPFNVHCTLSTAHRILNILHRTLDIVHHTPYSSHCTLHTEHCTIYTAHCIIHTTHCTLNTNYFFVWGELRFRSRCRYVYKLNKAIITINREEEKN